MSFVSQQIVRFAHVDAAGIVFYPRYFEMVNAAVEDYFADGIGVDFATMHLMHRLGVPTVKLDAEFLAPSRLGDALDLTIEPVRIGNSSADLTISIDCGGARRAKIALIIVCMNLDTGRAVPWPEALRPRPID